jgi:hypothetical protein
VSIVIQCGLLLLLAMPRKILKHLDLGLSGAEMESLVQVATVDAMQPQQLTIFSRVGVSGNWVFRRESVDDVSVEHVEPVCQSHQQPEVSSCLLLKVALTPWLHCLFAGIAMSRTTNVLFEKTRS